MAPEVPTEYKDPVPQQDNGEKDQTKLQTCREHITLITTNHIKRSDEKAV